MGKQNANPKKTRPLWLSLSIILGAFMLGAAAASLFWYNYHINSIKQIAAQVKPQRQQNDPYKFINPLLGYDVPGNLKEFNQYQPLQAQISQAVKAANDKTLQSYAVYFRDLTLGRWMGINEDTSYAPASMMKVVIMMAYYKEAEDNPTVLSQTYKYSPDVAEQILEVPFEAPSDLKVNQSYSVEQLIEAMIINSDNGAKNILLDNVDQNSLNEIYSDLGLPNPDNVDTSNYTISPKQYALLLRVLYNATYLSRDFSEQALGIMSKANYNEGLVAGVPNGTQVAQKFGENVSGTDGNAIISLSNCGVIYHPSHPYILCVMTKGTNLDNLAKTIALISQVTWKDVESYSQEGNY